MTQTCNLTQLQSNLISVLQPTAYKLNHDPIPSPSHNQLQQHFPIGKFFSRAGRPPAFVAYTPLGLPRIQRNIRSEPSRIIKTCKLNYNPISSPSYNQLQQRFPVGKIFSKAGGPAAFHCSVYLLPWACVAYPTSASGYLCTLPGECM